MSQDNLSQASLGHTAGGSLNSYGAPATLASLRDVLVTGEIQEYLGALQREVKRMRDSIDLLNRADQLGLDMVYLTRQEALHTFLRYLKGYVERQESKLYIVGSSLKGAIEMIPDFRDVLEKARRTESSPKKELHVLLTHPFYSSFRENQEDRSAGDIADEIFQSIRLLRQMGITETKLYKGTPTCFLIATDECMLLNPYPYEKEAFESFCLIVRKVDSPNSIYYQYIMHHFYEPWQNRRGNALEYQYFRLEGPNPGQTLSDGPDFFVIQDAKEFYLAAFLRGVPGLPTVVKKETGAGEKEDGLEPAAAQVPEFIPLGDQFVVKLLRVHDDGRVCEWEEFKGQQYFNPERRRGKVIGSHPGDFKEFAMVGVFSRDDTYRNPHTHKLEWAPLGLKGQPLPLFWTPLPRPRESAISAEGSLSPTLALLPELDPTARD